MILRAFRDPEDMLNLYLASECSSRNLATPHLEELQAMRNRQRERALRGLR